VPAGEEGEKYYAGGFNGGSTKEFLKMSEVIADRVTKDLENDVIALWHDVSIGMVLFALYHGIGLIVHRIWSDKRGKAKESNIVFNWLNIFATYMFVVLSFPLLVMPLDKAGQFYLALVGM
ncbi:MAG: hypothetical protein HRT94_00240, partial [Alphaproteobacteria bacterium]|nr:hypothetical protein [Alphaproteobacteria bacterium]